ncbi:MAG: flagellar biosynthetic protein FliR [Pseudomonadota bacterium]|nr:flagellar biosynthetic protein FliR [Pseudomonadota bacterium]
MSFAITDLMLLVERFLLPFIRLGALFVAAPFFGAVTVPVRVRIVLALAVTAILMPVLGDTVAVELLSADGLLLILQQVAVGLAMGLMLQFVVAAIVMAGHTIATAMGLGFASSVDPQNGTQVTILGQFYLILATLFFLAIDGHLRLLDLLAASFDVFPVARYVLDAAMFQEVVLYSAQMFVTGTLLALPVMIGVLLINVGFGVMTRAAPQLNLFSIGFPMSMLGGFVLMLLSLPIVMPVLGNAYDAVFTLLTSMFTR